jgi:hypothetical protein
VNYSLKYIKLDSQGKPIQIYASDQGKIVFTKNLAALQDIKDREQKKYRDRRYIIVDENDNPVEASAQVPVEVDVRASKQTTNLEELRKRVKRL